MPSGIHTGFGFRQNGGRANNTDISVYYAGTEELRLNGTALLPRADASLDLGSTAVGFNDLHLGSGGVVNFDGGDVTLTHAANVLTMAGGDLYVANGNGMVIGHTAQIVGSFTSELQLLGAGGADDADMLVGAFSADASGGSISFVKSRHATVGSNTIVNDNDIIGQIVALPADGVDFGTFAADYRMEVDDGTPAAGDIGMAHVWRSLPGGGGALRETLRLAANGDLASNQAQSAAVKTFTWDNSANDAGAGARIQVEVGGSTADTDAIFAAVETGSHVMTMGIDNSASIGVVAMNTALGSADGDALRITDATPPVVSYNAAHPTGTFDYVCDTCGKHGGEPFTCHGVQAAWHDDVLSLAPVLGAVSGQRLSGYEDGVQHLAKLGVMEVTPSDLPEEAGKNWVGINLQNAQWFTWSAMQQMYNRVQELESRLAKVGA